MREERGSAGSLARHGRKWRGREGERERELIKKIVESGADDLKLELGKKNLSSGHRMGLVQEGKVHEIIFTFQRVQGIHVLRTVEIGKPPPTFLKMTTRSQKGTELN